MLCMDPDDHAAIQAVLAGDKEAYAVLVVRHSRRLHRVAFRTTGNQADAEDVIQEALLRGYRKLESFESRSDFGTWIYRIAVRCALEPNRLNMKSGIWCTRVPLRMERLRPSDGWIVSNTG